ncbi:exosortase A [Erythrobacter sp. SDW2]|uniref:exosortase A n=1 Tax=Erythrobacter sp. SDW2 TaxID=2907154 RepID=UPI001F40B246|nr:exosortase A [Erythrobacter sp. SDW2]UIP05652.1 exosortase A [Erythrobacter sp. SDW2]
MPPEATLAAPRPSWRDRIAPAWRQPLLRLALLWSAILLVTLRDWFAMAEQWWNISTYNHVLLVPPIIALLVWFRREELAKLAPRAGWPGLLALAGALALWFLGTIGEVNSFSQLGAVAALQASVVTLLGPRVAVGLLFPLGYMLFLVPFGDELVPALQMITAKITIALTHWSGIPAEIDGVFIDTPAGLFEVAEACSGVKFLIAMIALGVLVAQSCFRSWQRRALFLAVCVIVPIIANGIRAWGTIYIAQSQGVEFAAGFDHIFYGWVFFGIVIAIVLAAGWRWFDRSPEDPGIDGEALARMPGLDALERLSICGNRALLGGAALIALFAVWAMLASRLEARLPETVSLPQVPGWQLSESRPELAWLPRAAGADHRLLGTYRNAAGQEVEVFLALYSAQGEGREPSAPNEGALVPETDWRWLSGETGPDGAKVDRLFALGRIRRTAETRYRQGDLLTGSATDLKLATIADRLALRAEPAAMLILSAVEQKGQPAPEVIVTFRRSTGPLGPWIDRIAQSR